MAGKPGVKMPCGWSCGKKVTCSDMRKHFTECPKRPKQKSLAKKLGNIDRPYPQIGM